MALTPYAYHAGNSAPHRAPAALKLVALALVSATAFFAFPTGALVASCGLSFAALVAKIPPLRLLRGAKPLLFMALLALFTRSCAWDPLRFSPDGLREGLAFASGLVVSFAAAALFFSLTTMTELKRSLDAIARWTHCALLRRASLGISLMLGFIPRFFELWETASLAYRARAGKNNVRKLLIVLPLVLERMLEIAGETAAALEMRGVE